MKAAGLAALVALAGCSAQPPGGPADNGADNAAPEAPLARPAATPLAKPAADAPLAKPAADAPLAKPAADAPLAQWLVGHWAYEDDCATDFSVLYSADGRLDAHGEVGSWKAEGDQVTETITERMGEAGTEPVDPPETIRYTVEKLGADRGLLRRGDKSQPIRRC